MKIKNGDLVEVARNYGSPWLDVYIGQIAKVVGTVPDDDYGQVYVLEGMTSLLFAPGELIKREELVSEVDLLVEELLHEELVESNLS